MAATEQIAETGVGIAASVDGGETSAGDTCSSGTDGHAASKLRALSHDDPLENPVVTAVPSHSDAAVKEEPSHTDEEAAAAAAATEAPPRKRRRRRTAAEMLEAATALYLDEQPIKDKQPPAEPVRPAQSAAPVKKRGPGRPPKKAAAAKTTIAKAKPKPVTARAAAAKKRGRPAVRGRAKKPVVDGGGGVKRGRGRPPKKK